MTRLAVLLSFLLAVATARARIGETADEVSRRYGPVIERNVVIANGQDRETAERHEKNGLQIWVVYNDLGRVALIRFAPVADAPALLEGDVRKLLAASGGAVPWRRDDAFTANGSTLFYATAPHAPSLTGVWDHDEHTSSLQIYEMEFAIRRKVQEVKRSDAEQQKRLQGF